MQSLVMISFRACANTPEVSFVANNDEEERAAFLDWGLPVGARVKIKETAGKRTYRITYRTESHRSAFHHEARKQSVLGLCSTDWNSPLNALVLSEI